MAHTRFMAIFICALVLLPVLGGCVKTYRPPEAIGVPNRQPLDDQELKAALLRAKQLVSLGRFDDPDLGNILARASPHFPVLPVMVGEEQEPWTKIQLNTAGAGFDAIRFSSPQDAPDDLLFAIAYDSRPLSSFHLKECGETPEMRGIFKIVRQWVALEGVDLPDKNTLIQVHLNGGQIRPGKEYFLHFEFDDPRPMVAYARLKLIPSRRGAYVMHDELAAELGIPNPLPLNSLAPLSTRVNELLLTGHSVEARLLVEKAMQAPNVPRATRSLHADVLLCEGNRVAKSGDRAAATPLFLQSAQEMRKLKQEFRELTPNEMRVYGAAIYREACCLAIFGKTDEALRSLGEAVRHGFNQWQQVTEDQELDSLWGPEFNELIKQMQFPALALPGDPRNKSVPGVSANAWIAKLASVFSGTSRVALVFSAIAIFLLMVMAIFRRALDSRTHTSFASPGKHSQPWRFRFSVRGLAIFVVLICAYLSSWGITKKYAVVTSPRHRSQLREGPDGFVRDYDVTIFEDSPMPFVICRSALGAVETRRYFLWLFGAEHLILERNVNQNSGWEILWNHK